MKQFNTIVGIGASTGGPKALQRVLTDLPEDFPAPVLIVQHMPPGFTKSLAKRLNQVAGIHVKEAIHGEVIEPGTAYIAPGDYHMKANHSRTKYYIGLTREKERSGQRPSVDALFESIAHFQLHKIVAVLTGMGRDGADGIRLLKYYDCVVDVIAESEQTCVVYGMPKAAMETNDVNHCAPLQQIGVLLQRLVEGTHS
ncbi:CheB methylesterase domain-containing protein [Lentibacillus salinarum]|uniref:protein-glutamate methylesterase n=1 Tax=Lentibacillus salinarum TaxID=446820 RepID=A0ABW3ZRB1_9BACI